jgi:D-methionine transport system ATP-binding protein
MYSIEPQTAISQEFFPRRLNRAPRPGASVATIAFNEELADEPIFSTLTRNFNVTVNLLSGSVEPIGDRRVGQFQIELTGEKVADALKYLHELNFAVEVH